MNSLLRRAVGRKGIPKRRFSTQEQEAGKPPVYEFEAPKDSFRNFESTPQFIKRYLLLFPISAIILYDFCFIRRNKYTKKREFKFLNYPFEAFLMGPLISRKILEKYKGLVFKESTEESKRVEKIYRELVEGNRLSEQFSLKKVKVLHTDIMVLFISLD